LQGTAIVYLINYQVSSNTSAVAELSGV